MVTLIDYGVGNISALENVYRALNIKTKIAKTAFDLESSEKLILPGVGSFDYAMEKLNKSGMREKLDSLVLVDKIPVLGICVGMQMMANSSQEGQEPGLKWLDAAVLKFDIETIPFVTKIPHMGWNNISIIQSNKLLKNLENHSLFYFLHSYYFEYTNGPEIIASSNYGSTFSAVVNKDNVYGVQFHPEKSHHYGETLLANFANL